MNTLREAVKNVKHAIEACRCAEEAAPDRLESADEELQRAAYALAEHHEEIAALRHAASSPTNALRFTLRNHVPAGGLLLYRGAERWMRDMGPESEAVSMRDHDVRDSGEALAEAFDYAILADYRHVIIVRPR